MLEKRTTFNISTTPYVVIAVAALKLSARAGHVCQRVCSGTRAATPRRNSCTGISNGLSGGMAPLMVPLGVGCGALLGRSGLLATTLEPNAFMALWCFNSRTNGTATSR
jgi:hypothetical protein